MTAQTPPPASQTSTIDIGKKQGRLKLNLPVFIGSAATIVAFLLWAWLAPEQAGDVLFGLVDWISSTFGWYYILTAAVILFFIVAVAISKSGKIKLGPDHSKPKYNKFTWASMLFVAGIGTDVTFYAVAGPATNYFTPPEGAPESAESARHAIGWTLFHWGIMGWAMYALMGLAFGLFTYRYHLPLSIRSALAPIFGRRIKGAAGDAVEISAMIGSVFGIATTLGISVVFMQYGLSNYLGVPGGTASLVALIGISVVIAIISSVSGIDKGVRRLSELNIILAIFLVLYVLFAGDARFQLNALVQNIGDFVARFPHMMLNTFAYDDGQSSYAASDWMADWTLFFWGWWLAWAPFVGLFMARISRGRTIREFLMGSLMIPFAFILIWMSVFGNAAIARFRVDPEFLQASVDVPESGFFLLLQEYPGGIFVIGLALLTGLVFFITSADSGALVLANFSSKMDQSNRDGAPWLRIFWAVVTGALTVAMLFIGGIPTLQAATVILGLPFSVIMYLVMISVWRVLRQERLATESRENVMRGLLAGRSGGQGEKWQKRLARQMSYPTSEQVTHFIENTAGAALEEVAGELREKGASVLLTRGTDPQTELPFIDLQIPFEGGESFRYQVYPVAHPTPSYAFMATDIADAYYRANIFQAAGSQHRDVYGYSKKELIQDLLDAYEEHLLLLESQSSPGSRRKKQNMERTGPIEWLDAHDGLHRDE